MTKDAFTVVERSNKANKSVKSSGKTTLVQKYGDISVSTASLNLLLSFLLRKLGYYSTLDSKVVKSTIIEWAETKIAPVVESKDQMRREADSILERQSRTGSATIFKSYWKTLDNGEKTSSSYWLDMKQLPLDDRNLPCLEKANMSCLLEQICARLEDLCTQLYKKRRCEYDQYIHDFFYDQYEQFKVILSEARIVLSDLNDFRRKFPGVRLAVDRSHLEKPSPAPVEPVQKVNTVEPEIKTNEPISVPIKGSVDLVKEGVSYASIISGQEKTVQEASQETVSNKEAAKKRSKAEKRAAYRKRKQERRNAEQSMQSDQPENVEQPVEKPVQQPVPVEQVEQSKPVQVEQSNDVLIRVEIFDKMVNGLPTFKTVIMPKSVYEATPYYTSRQN